MADTLASFTRSQCITFLVGGSKKDKMYFCRLCPMELVAFFNSIENFLLMFDIMVSNGISGGIRCFDMSNIIRLDIFLSVSLSFRILSFKLVSSFYLVLLPFMLRPPCSMFVRILFA